MKTTTKLVNNYNKTLGDPHDILGDEITLNKIDFEIRMFMGKTKETSSKDGLASHMKIIKRQKEIDEDSLVCRRCFKDLSVVGARWNDFLVIRAKDCTQPICDNCATNNPDSYHINYRKALELSKIDNDIKNRMVLNDERMDIIGEQLLTEVDKALMPMTSNNDYKNIEWLIARLREYASYIKLKDMTFLDDIPTDLAYAEKFFLNQEGPKK